MDEFLFECQYAQKLQPNTLKGYRNVLELFMKLNPDITLKEINSRLVVTFFNRLETRERVVGKGVIKTGIKLSTVATYRGKLNPFFSWLKNKGYIADNPFDFIAYRSPRYEDKKFLKREDIERILTAVIMNAGNNLFLLKRNILLFSLLVYCGLRKEELLRLQVRDIDTTKKELTVRAETSKSGTSRVMPLHPQIILHLKDYKTQRSKLTCEYLFVSSRKDSRLTSEGLNHLVNKIRDKSKVNFHLHQFRHTFAVNFLVQNHNIVKLKQLLGHKSISMTVIYLRCLPTKELAGDVAQMDIGNFI